jgi:hypothetical protein
MILYIINIGYTRLIIKLIEEEPMSNFTSEELQPSEKTLNIIRQIAYTYRTIKMRGKTVSYCLN